MPNFETDKPVAEEKLDAIFPKTWRSWGDARWNKEIGKLAGADKGEAVWARRTWATCKAKEDADARAQALAEEAHA